MPIILSLKFKTLIINYFTTNSQRPYNYVFNPSMYCFNLIFKIILCL